VRYIAAEYQRLRAEMEKRAERAADDESLRASIRTYNRNRRLLRELYAIRRDEPWKLSCTESYLLLRARTRISCEEHNVLLERAIAGIRARRRQAQDKPRVVFVGGFCEQPPLEMLEAIDDNCYVVDDDLLIGMRWFTEDVPEAGDPVWALAESYVERSAASPVQHDERKSKEGYLMAMIHTAKADAAIVTAAKFCEPGLDEQVAWSKHLDEVGVQYLVLEFEEKMTSFEQMAMQLETFAESLLFATA
jgi:benzoyl-CoA reductase subunit C